VIAVDTNVLVFAHREELPEHERALRWLRHLATGVVPWALPIFCVGEFFRVVTHSRVFAPPSTLVQAIDAMRGLRTSTSLRVLNPGAQFPRLFEEMLQQADARGNLVFDAQIAALCREHGVDRILTMDRDFARFTTPTPISIDEAPPGTWR